MFCLFSAHTHNRSAADPRLSLVRYHPCPQRHQGGRSLQRLAYLLYFLCQKSTPKCRSFLSPATSHPFLVALRKKKRQRRALRAGASAMASSLGSRLLLAAATLATASGAPCPNNCTGHGGCVDGACVCDFGWTNSDCSVKTCLRACSGRGLCYAGTCHCQPGWRGEACEQEQHECGHGVWSVALGHCDCDEGWGGEHCAVRACADDCHGRGECVEGVCECHRGFGGENCESKACARSERGECAGIGKCTNATCHCANTCHWDVFFEN